MSVELSGGFRLVEVKRYKRGAHWPEGEPRMCGRCAIEGRTRRRQAVLTAFLVRPPARFRMPVEWCSHHLPVEVMS
jgi:hypothetical protein